MAFPAEHFPNTPTWAQAAVAEAIRKTSMTASKWQVPLEAIGRYESNWGNNANLCNPDKTLPIGCLQTSRGQFADALTLHAIDALRYADPEYQARVAILYINSLLPHYGGYQGIGTVTGTVGLLPRTDKGPGNVLRAWIADPGTFNVEAARDLYRGY